MALNIFSGPNAVVSTGISDGVELDFLPNVNANTISVIYEIDGRYRSWVPGRDLNQFNTLRAGIGYLIVAKQGLDLSEYFIPPKPEGVNSVFVIGDGAGNVIGDGAGNLIGYTN